MNLPDRVTLEKLLRGQLAPEVAEQLCKQLENEDAFARVASEVMTDDTFVESLKRTKTSEHSSPSQGLQSLIEKFQGWDSSPLNGATVASPASSEINSPLPAVNASGDPTQIGNFRILKKLGQGGMGAVYLGQDVTLNRKAALKVMRPEVASNPEARERFLREARAAAALEHDNIVAIWQVGEDNGSPFIAMPFLQGESLEDRLRREPISPVGVILKLARETAHGLAAAHDCGLIHRDIKPANIWVEGDPTAKESGKVFKRAKILDFGLARLSDADVQLTSTGAILGTPAFMSPEQGRGLPLDARSDLFSLGVVLYRMATGEQPFKGNTMMAMLTSLAVDVPALPSLKNNRIPSVVSELITRLIEKEPENRYQTAHEVIAAVQEIGRALAATTGIFPAKAPAVVAQAAPVVEPLPALPAAPVANPFDGIDTEMMPPPAPKKTPRPAEKSSPPAKKSRKPLWLALGGLSTVLLLGFIVIKITNKDGSVTKIEVPEGAKVEVVENKKEDARVEAKKKDDPKTLARGPSDLPPLPKFEYKPIAVGQSPFDKLDAKEIPKQEKFDWQPKELVAVIGQHERRHWGGATVAISPDGKWGASLGLEDKLLHLYDMATHLETKVLPLDVQGRVSFSPDSRSVWVSTEKGLVGCPLTESKFTPAEAFAKNPEFSSPKLTPDGKTLLLYGWGVGNQVWQVEGDKYSLIKTMELMGNPNDFAHVGFSSDQKSVYHARREADGKPWEIEIVSLEKDKDQRKTLLTFPADTGPIWNGTGPAMLVSPDGKTFAVVDKTGGTNDCTLFDLTMTPPKEKAKFKWEGSGGFLLFSPDSSTLCRRYGQCHRVDITQNPPKPLETIPTISNGSVTMSPDSKTMMATDYVFIRFFDVGGEKLKELAPLQKNTIAYASIHGMGLSPMIAPGKGLLAAPVFRGTIAENVACQLWDLTGNTPKPWPNDEKSFVGQPGGYGPMIPLSALAPTGEFAVAYDAPYSPQRMRWTADGFEHQEKIHQNKVLPYSSTALGLNLLSPSAEVSQKHYRLWDISEPYEKARALPELDGMPEPAQLDVRSDRSLLATIDGELKVTLWNLSGEKATKVAVLPERANRVVLSPDGRWLIRNLATVNGVGYVDDLSGKQPKRATQFGEDFQAVAVTFSPDAKRVYSSDYAGNLRGYDVATGKVVWEAKLPGAAAWIQMAPDGRHLFTHNANGTIYVLRLNHP